MEKKLLRVDRQRKFPQQFSWIDQRLIREKHFQLCNAKSLGVYLFLIMVGDSQGLSYYSETSICKNLSINMIELTKSRQELINADLLAYEKPLYQVLSIPSLKDQLGINCTSNHKNEGFVSVEEVFKTIGRQI